MARSRAASNGNGNGNRGGAARRGIGAAGVRRPASAHELGMSAGADRGRAGPGRGAEPRFGRGPVPTHLGVSDEARRASVRGLDQLLADLTALRALYKHFHWRVAGRRFIMLHELYDKHAAELLELIDKVAERIQLLGGLATAWPGDVAELTRLRPPPPSTRSPDEQLRELLEAHRLILEFAHDVVEQADDNADAGTSDLIGSQIIPQGQLQAWFVGEHLDHVGSD